MNQTQLHPLPQTSMSPHVCTMEENLVWTAIYEEHCALVAYAQVIDYFGSLMPFVAIQEVKSRRIQMLQSMIASNETVLPYDTRYCQQINFQNMMANYGLGVWIEQQNAVFYKTISQQTKSKKIKRVFSGFAKASQEKTCALFNKEAKLSLHLHPRSVGKQRTQAKLTSIALHTSTILLATLLLTRK